MTTTATLNGFSLRDLGFIVEDITPFAGPVGRDVGSVPLPGTLGTMLLDGVVTPQPASLQIVGTFVQETAALRIAAEDRLKDLAHSGLMRLVHGRPGSPLRMTHVVLSGRNPIQPMRPVLSSRGSKWSIPLYSPHGVWQLLEPRALHLDTVDERVPIVGLGSLPSTPILRLIGSVTPVDQSIVYRNAAGDEKARFASKAGAAGFNLGANDWADIDCRYGTIVVYRAGVAENGIDYFTTASDFPFSFAPQDADPATGQLPTLEVTAGTATAMYATVMG